MTFNEYTGSGTYKIYGDVGFELYNLDIIKSKEITIQYHADTEDKKILWSIHNHFSDNVE